MAHSNILGGHFSTPKSRWKVKKKSLYEYDRKVFLPPLINLGRIIKKTIEINWILTKIKIKISPLHGRHAAWWLNLVVIDRTWLPSCQIGWRDGKSRIDFTALQQNSTLGLQARPEDKVFVTGFGGPRARLAAWPNVATSQLDFAAAQPDLAGQRG